MQTGKEPTVAVHRPHPQYLSGGREYHLCRAGCLGSEHKTVWLGTLVVLYRLLRAGLPLLQPAERLARSQASGHVDAFLLPAVHLHHCGRRNRAGWRHQRIRASASHQRLCRAVERTGAYRAAELPVGRPDRE